METQLQEQCLEKLKIQLQTILRQESVYFASYHRAVWIKKD